MKTEIPYVTPFRNITKISLHNCMKEWLDLFLLVLFPPLFFLGIQKNSLTTLFDDGLHLVCTIDSTNKRGDEWIELNPNVFCAIFSTENLLWTLNSINLIGILIMGPRNGV